MTPVFVNSAFVGAPERFVLRKGRWNWMKLKVRFGFLDHPAHGPMLIDTGYSQHVTAAGSSRALRAYTALLQPTLVSASPALDFLSAKGIKPDDVRTIIISHFHADHVSALKDFSKARFLASHIAWDNLSKSSRWANIRHGRFAELVPKDFSDRFVPFEATAAVTAPAGLGIAHDLFADGSVIAVDLPGHAAGHYGFYFGQMDRPLLYGVDVQWLPQAVTDHREPGFPATRIYENISDARHSADRLRRFAAAGGDFLLCHQPERHHLDSDWTPA